MFGEDRLGQNTQVCGDFWGFSEPALGSVMSEERQFGAAEFTRVKMLFDERSDQRRELFGPERKQGPRRRTSGRFSECELLL